jgi:FkbM family methyltransferase
MFVFLRKVRAAITPRDWLLKTSLAGGAVVYGRNRAGWGSRGIYVFRDALEPEFENLEKFLVPGGVFLDVGANIGIYTVKAAKFLGASGGTVVAYEPLAEMLAQLTQNVAANALDNVRVRGFCLGATRCTAEFWVNFQRPVSAGLVKSDPASAKISTVVWPLDEVFPLERLDRLDYVKLDVEGAEAQVLAGAVEVFKKYRPIVQLEVSHANASLNLPQYSEWQAPGGPNKICLPDENAKKEVASRLGWQRLA